VKSADFSKVLDVSKLQLREHAPALARQRARRAAVSRGVDPELAAREHLMYSEHAVEFEVSSRDFTLPRAALPLGMGQAEAAPAHRGRARSRGSTASSSPRGC
jgi:hypothetical protein